MGLNDDREMLDACRADVVALEREHAELKRRIEEVSALHRLTTPPQTWAGLAQQMCMTCSQLWPCKTARALGVTS